MRSKIRTYLAVHPGSSARQIKVGIGVANKTEVNSCLYSHIDVKFQKIGEAPPLWWNRGDPSMGQQVHELEVIDNEDYFSDPAVAPTSVHDLVEIKADDSVYEEKRPFRSVTNVSQRFSVCGECGQIIGSKGHCGC